MLIRFDIGDIEVSQRWSNRDHTGDKDLRGMEDGVVVYGSCFSQLVPDTSIFRTNMTGVTFRNCNLMNVLIPPGNVTIDCQTQRYAVQRDGKDWEIDENNKPVRPLDWKVYIKRGLPVPTPEDL